MGYPVRTTAAVSRVAPANASTSTGTVVPFPRWLLLVILCIAQMAFARVLVAAPLIGTAQAAAILLGAVYFAFRRNMIMLLTLAAYLPSAEIAWRQVRTPTPWLIAPYTLIAIGVLGTVTAYSKLTKPGRLALLYVALLLPSSIITISTAGSGSREYIAFAIAGPATLASLVVLFSQIGITRELYRRLLWVVVISGLAPLAVALTRISDYVGSGRKLVFDSQSNYLTSGGFGPVQVSSVMGLTVLAAILVFLAEDELIPRLLCTAIGLLATVQSFLTFSRGGMFATAIAVAALALAQSATPGARMRTLAVVIVVFAFGYFVIVPRLDSFTNGAFDKRFSDTHTGRTDLAANDIVVFRSNLAFGVGPGMSKYQRLSYDVCQVRSDKCVDEASSHTEFTRMLAEHGIEGLISIILLGMMAYHAVVRAGPSRSMTITFLAWSIAQMFYANLRVSAVALAFAFSFLRITDGTPATTEPEAPPPVGRFHAPVLR